jgi:methylmalonyl-CoA mutase
MNFTDVFAKSSLSEWQEKITKDLKGESMEELIWQSELGPIDPILFNYSNKFQRVDAHANQADNAWSIAQTFDCTDPKKANTEILIGLAGGINCLHLINLKASDLPTVLDQVMVDIITTKIYHEVEDLAIFQKAINDLPNNNENNIILLADPIGCYIGGYLANMQKVSSTAVVRTSIFENAGASIQNQLGLSLAMAHEYFLQLQSSGMTKEDAAKNIYFELAIGNSYFAEIAKIRAFRSLWNTVLESYDVDFKNVNIHSVTSSFYQSNLDVHNNLLRGTTAAMAATIAGVQSLEVLTYDNQLSEKQGDGARLAKNISLLLQEEAYLNQVKNAANGAYYIEQLTDIIIEKSWKIFQDIEAKGGFLKAFEEGMIQDNIAKDLESKIEQFKSNEITLIGTNKQLNKLEKNTENYLEPTKGKFIQSYRLAQTKLS